MSKNTAVSLVVVSRDREKLLRRFLLAAAQLRGIEFDLVVVSNGDAPAILGIEIRHVPYLKANVSAARNAGIRAAMGDIIAFCDDDSVPEPEWLHRLVAPFAQPKVGAVGGVVLGRNGVSMQWGVIEIDSTGSEKEASIKDGTPTFSHDSVKVTLGTNCAFRRSALEQQGGFDEAFHYYLDEADMNWRLSQAGWQTAFVPDAVVHHSYATNRARNHSRAPLDLMEIFASKAVFLKKHYKQKPLSVLKTFAADHKRRAVSAFDLGQIDGRSLNKLKRSIEEGIDAGVNRPCGLPVDIRWDGNGARKMPEKEGISVALCGGTRHLSAMRRSAKTLLDQGMRVSLFCFGLSTYALKVKFETPGFWIHQGGIFGRTLRGEPIFQFRRRKTRISQEIDRISDQRKFDYVAFAATKAAKGDSVEFSGLECFDVQIREH